VHYIGHYTIPFQNARSVQHKILRHISHRICSGVYDPSLHKVCVRLILLIRIILPQSYCFTPQKIRVITLTRLKGWWLRDCRSLPVSGSFLQNVQISPFTHPPSYLLGTRGFFPMHKTARCMKLTSDLNLLSLLRMSRAMPPLPHVLSWHVQGQLYLHMCGEYLTSFRKNMDSFTLQNFWGQGRAQRVCSHIHRWQPRSLSGFQKMLENVCYVDRCFYWGAWLLSEVL
jgi:hypothetical protein